MRFAKKFRSCIPIMIALTMPHRVIADASNCYSINNKDQKSYCLALAKNEKSYCYSIQEKDAKNFCLAQLGNQKSYCYSIRSKDAKNQCLAQIR